MQALLQCVSSGPHTSLHMRHPSSHAFLQPSPISPAKAQLPPKEKTRNTSMLTHKISFIFTASSYLNEHRTYGGHRGDRRQVRRANLPHHLFLAIPKESVHLWWTKQVVGLSQRRFPRNAVGFPLGAPARYEAIHCLERRAATESSRPAPPAFFRLSSIFF